jgi:Flp pilus assembly protein TadB
MQNVFCELSVLCVTVATGAAAYGMMTAMTSEPQVTRPAGEQPPLFAALRPGFLLFAPLSNRILRAWPALERWIQGNLTAAGFGHVVRPDEYMSIRFVLALLLAVAGLPFGGAIHAGLVVLGLAFPDLWILGAIQERHAAVRCSMPYVVDLLALCTLAGLEFGSAIDRVLAKIGGGPLKEELQLARRDMALGRSLSGSLQEMAKRIRMAEMTSFVAILCQGLDLGAGVAQVLAAQAEKMRLERMEKAERSGAQAQQKILLPLLLLMVPAFACLVFIPLLMSQAKTYLAGFGGL